jgi:hypothetical protein
MSSLSRTLPDGFSHNPLAVSDHLSLQIEAFDFRFQDKQCKRIRRQLWRRRKNTRREIWSFWWNFGWTNRWRGLKYLHRRLVLDQGFRA